jgi:hypothetical protein
MGKSNSYKHDLLFCRHFLAHNCLCPLYGIPSVCSLVLLLVLHTGFVPRGHEATVGAGCQDTRSYLLHHQHVHRNYFSRIQLCNPYHDFLVTAHLFLPKYDTGCFWNVQSGLILHSYHRWTKSRLVI